MSVLRGRGAYNIRPPPGPLRGEHATRPFGADKGTLLCILADIERPSRGDLSSSETGVGRTSSTWAASSRTPSATPTAPADLPQPHGTVEPRLQDRMGKAAKRSPSPPGLER
jgi:hypothetical protein